MVRKRLCFLIFLLPSVCFGQITKPGVNGQNWGTNIGRALTINCSNIQVGGNCLTCTMLGTTMTIALTSSCTPPSLFVTYLGVQATYLGQTVTYLGL